MASVVLCDRQELRRLGLVAALAASDVEVVAEATNEEDAARYVNGHKPDVLVVGDDHDLAALAAHARDLCPWTKVLALARRGSGAGVWREMLVVSDALVLDDEHYSRFVSAVQCVCSGSAYVDGDAVREVLLLEESGKDLSERERDVLSLVARGFTNKEIGEMLYLSIRTVESHRAHLMDKLGIVSRHELVDYAVKNGLFPIEA